MDDITGHVYIITCKSTGKQYVGQALSHRLNRGKYKPFGYQGRFRDHISEAVCNTKKKQCRYLNNAIRKYGAEQFTVELIEECLTEILDEKEKYYIGQYNTLYPNGYNLTHGGKTTYIVNTPDVDILEPNTPGKRGGCSMRSDETRNRISHSLKESFNSEDYRNTVSKRVQTQHSSNKYQRFKDSKIDINNLDKYLYERNSKTSGKYIMIKVDNKRANFIGKNNTVIELKELARNFLKEIATATLLNCSGKP